VGFKFTRSLLSCSFSTAVSNVIYETVKERMKKNPAQLHFKSKLLRRWQQLGLGRWKS
jgi:hypothetical protein